MQAIPLFQKSLQMFEYVCTVSSSACRLCGWQWTPTSRRSAQRWRRTILVVTMTVRVELMTVMVMVMVRSGERKREGHVRKETFKEKKEGI